MFDQYSSTCVHMYTVQNSFIQQKPTSITFVISKYRIEAKLPWMTDFNRFPDPLDRRFPGVIDVPAVRFILLERISNAPVVMAISNLPYPAVIIDFAIFYPWKIHIEFLTLMWSNMHIWNGFISNVTCSFESYIFIFFKMSYPCEVELKIINQKKKKMFAGDFVS